MKMYIAFAALAAAIFAAVMFSGCGPKQDESTLVEVKATKTAVASIGLKYSPDPPVALKETMFTVTVHDETGGPLSGATVELDLSMPGMYHGENRPAMAETSPGVYEGKGILTMGGGWLARIGVSGELVGGSTEVRFDAVDK